MCALALTSCTVLFESTDPSLGPDPQSEEEQQEFMVALEGDMASPGLELYIGRTIDGVSYIEPYDSSATPQPLTDPFELPIVLTAMAQGLSNFPNLLIMGTADATGDGTREREYIDRVSWGAGESVTEASLSDEFLHAFGPAVPGAHSFINANIIATDNPPHFSTGRAVTLVDSRQGWDNLEIDPMPWLTTSEPIRCMRGHGLGLGAHEIAAFAGSTLVLADNNTLQGDQTLHDVELRSNTMEFEMNACTYDSSENDPTYITTDGAELHAIGLNPAATFIAAETLPGVSLPHQELILLELIRFGGGSDPDLVLVVADPPTVYVGLNMEVQSDGLNFDIPVFAQSIDFIPTAALQLGNGPGGGDRLYISEENGPPHCFELNTSIISPQLIPCVD